MDRNTITGFVLIGILLFAFSWLNRPSQEELAQKRLQDSIARVENARIQAEIELARLNQSNALAESMAETGSNTDSVKNIQLQNQYGAFAAAATGQDSIISLENDLLSLKFSTHGGQLVSAQLKDYTRYDSTALMLFDQSESQFGLVLTTNDNRVINTENLYFEPVGNDDNSLTLRLHAGGEGQYLDFVYSLHQDDYLLDFKIVPTNMNRVLSPSSTFVDLRWTQKMRQQELGRKFEDQRTQLYYKYATDNVDYLSESSDESKSISNRVKWIGYKGQFFSTVLIANESFESTSLETKSIRHGEYIKEFVSNSVVPFDSNNANISFIYYLGPNKYNLLKSYDKTKFEGQDMQLERLVPLGWSLFRFVNQWIIIPIFDWLVKMCGDLGLAIFLLTLIIKVALFPLSRKSLLSSAKMKVLKPEVEEINEKYPGQENAMTRQQKSMELYRKAGASPMSGCLPMMLQMPFFIALFMFFPSAIELRHQSFLWATDLSTYDAVISWKTHIPFISEYFGNHISLFCILMTLTNIVYTKFNMEQANAGQQQMPGMKMMMYFMPLMMLVFLNQYPAGLNYYYFISTLITILQTLAFRYFLDENKLRAQIEANRKNPVKKSGFMARLEDAQRKQLELQKQRQKQAKGGRR